MTDVNEKGEKIKGKRPILTSRKKNAFIFDTYGKATQALNHYPIADYTKAHKVQIVVLDMDESTKGKK